MLLTSGGIFLIGIRSRSITDDTFGSDRYCVFNASFHTDDSTGSEVACVLQTISIRNDIVI